MQKNNGEIATVITIGTLIILGLTSLVSSIFLSRPQTTKTKAETTDQCACQNGQIINKDKCGDTNPCGPEGGDCSDKGYGAWKSDCTGSAENCPADAGVTYTYWCDGSKWKFQYPNCTTWCKPAYLTQAPTPAKGGLCDGKSPGTIITDQFSGNPPEGVVTGTSVNVSDFKYVSCDGNQGVYVEMNAFCDQFGQVQWGPSRKSSTTCIPPNITTAPAAGGPISLSLNIYVTQTTTGVNFNPEAVVTSSDCDGDLSFYRDGGFITTTRWNRAAHGLVYTMPKEYMGNVSVQTGASVNTSYMARLDNCPRSKVPLTSAVSCNFGVSPYGIPWVRGAGCNLANYSDVAKITPLPTPTFQPRVTWAPPPTPKITLAPIIFSQKPTPGREAQVSTGCELAGICSGTNGPSVWKYKGQFYTYFCPPEATSTRYSSFDAACKSSRTSAVGCDYKGTHYTDTFCFDNSTQGICLNNGAYTTQSCLSGKCENNKCTETTATSSCIDSFSGRSVSCPTNTYDARSNMWISVQCGTNCDIKCFNQAKNQQLECVSEGFNESPADMITGSFQIIIINSSKKKITIKTVSHQENGLGVSSEWFGSGDKLSDELSPAERKTYNEWGSCAGWLGFSRHIKINYTVKGDDSLRGITIARDAGCEKRIVIDIE